MNLADTLDLAMRNLSQSKLRTSLTTLGVSIGIASLAGMVSLGVGLQNQVVGRFTQSGVFDAMTVTNFRPTIGRGGIQNLPPAPSSLPKLDDEVVKQIAAMEHVRDVYPNLRVPVELNFGEFSQAVTAMGVPMSSKGEGVFQTFSYGEFFSSESDSCLLSLDMAKQITSQDPGNLVGKTLKLTYAASPKSSGDVDALTGIPVRRVDVQCRITGIVERDPAPLAGGNPGLASGVMIPLRLAKTINDEAMTTAQSLLGNSAQLKNYAAIVVRVNQPRFTQDVEDRIRKMGYTVFSVNDALRGAKNAFIIMDIVLSLVGSIALAVSSLGIVNTMVMSILERTREIGIMKAIGASDNDIRKIFLIEASVIGVAGGLIGIVLGWGAGKVINFGANIYIRSQGGLPGNMFSLPLWLVAASIAFSILVSLMAGSYPASRAAKLNPIQALRHD
jgi:putative ABC transport system permease protein